MKALCLTVIAILAAMTPVLGADEETAAHELAAAARSWDVEAATLVLSGLRRTPERESDRRLAVRVEAGLLVAELLRVEYEQTPAEQRVERRLLGQRIDAAAEEALALVDRLAESSERERMRADLLATLIRSDFRAKQHEAELKAAVARALELDPDNPRALVTAAKPWLFADAEHGGDPRQAIVLLDRALALDPELEPALLLRALAHDVVGDHDAAIQGWRRALERNPQCRPARWQLEHAGAQG